MVEVLALTTSALTSRVAANALVQTTVHFPHRMPVKHRFALTTFVAGSQILVFPVVCCLDARMIVRFTMLILQLAVTPSAASHAAVPAKVVA